MHLRNLFPRIRTYVVLNLLFVLAILLTLTVGYSIVQTHASSTHTANTLSANQAFTEAASEFQVPVSLLKTICYMEGRLSNHGGSPSIDNGFGCMHLVKNSQADTLDQAATDLGVSVSLLQQDLPTNIRGGAAILRDTALQLSSNHTLPTNLADWYGTMAAYSHVAVRSTALMYADAVYTILKQGFTAQTDTGETVTLAPQAVTPNTTTVGTFHTLASLPGGCTNDGNVDYPGAIDCIVSQNQSQDYDCNTTPTSTCTYSSSNRPSQCTIVDTAISPTATQNIQPCTINQIVIHDTEGSATSALSVFQDINSHESVHYLVDVDGTVYQLLREKDVAFHAGNTWYNEHSIGIEHVGFDAQGYQWYNAAEYLASAKLVAYLLKKYNLPLDRSHIVAHGTVPSPSLAASPNHEDPGPYWLWDYYFSLINQQGVPFPAGNLPPNTITLHPQNNQTLNGAETPADYNFFKLYNGPSTRSGVIPQQGSNDPIDVSYSVEPGISYYFVAKASDAAGTGDTMYEIWYGEEDQVHTAQSSLVADGHLAWLDVPAGAGVEGHGVVLFSQAQVTLSPSDGSTPQIYGRPTSNSADIIGNAPIGSIFTTGYT
ncbi:MAG: N-acetylmuramoyl-L-alanine amidase, partial [Ktedonobacteraceae bacterium]